MADNNKRVIPLPASLAGPSRPTPWPPARDACPSSARDSGRPGRAQAGRLAYSAVARLLGLLRRSKAPGCEGRTAKAGWLVFVGFLWLGALTLRATDYYVATDGAGGDFLSWATAASNIQDAVNVACGSVDHTVWVSNGAYRLTNQVTVTNRITVRGLNGYSNTFVYADWPTWTTRCFYVSRTGIVDGFTISNGHNWVDNDYNGGGGMLIATGTVQNCYFKNNVCSNNGLNSGGGGVYLKDQGTVLSCTFIANTSLVESESRGGGAINIFRNGSVLSCTITNNRTGGRGGGIFIGSDFSGSPLISNCTFNNNYALNIGGAIFLSQGYMVDCVMNNHNSGGGNPVQCYGAMRNCVVANNNNITHAVGFDWGGSATNCRIYNNSSNNRGAGARISGSGSTPTTPISVLEGCTFSNNICTDGAGGGAVSITNRGVLRNCLIINNTNLSSTGNGGGVLLGYAAKNDPGTSGLFNCTIVNNYSTNEGGGICTLGPSNYIVNCVIASNSSSAGNYPNVYHKDNVDANKSNYYYSCAVTTDAYLFAANQGNITNDPALAGAGAGNWRLAANSPCMNRGTNQNWMTNSVDLDGRTRIRYGTVDMGTYERINEGTIYNFQ